MDVAQVVRELGGIADSATLTDVMSRHQLQAALRDGSVVRLGRGLYTLPDVEQHAYAARRLNGALDLASAARHHGWKVKLEPERPQVVVPRGRNVSALRRRGVDLRWGTLSATELRDRVLTPEHAVLECARHLDFDEAVAVADSALRAGLSKTTLLLSAAKLPRTGRSRALEVIEFADRRADNPFESALRAIVRTVPGTFFEPQVWVDSIGRVDLCDRRRKLILEADSFEFHSDSFALNRDMERYNAFVCADHLVLRFGWRHAMFEPDYVRATVGALVSAQERSVGRCPRCLVA